MTQYRSETYRSLEREIDYLECQHQRRIKELKEQLQRQAETDRKEEAARRRLEKLAASKEGC